VARSCSCPERDIVILFGAREANEHAEALLLAG
jgi:hypothetical protein